jgi:hypothetical protein
MTKVFVAFALLFVASSPSRANDLASLINGFPKALSLTKKVEVLGTAKDGSSTIVLYQNFVGEIHGAHCYSMNPPALWACDIGEGKWIQVTK